MPNGKKFYRPKKNISNKVMVRYVEYGNPPSIYINKDHLIIAMQKMIGKHITAEEVVRFLEDIGDQ